MVRLDQAVAAEQWADKLPVQRRGLELTRAGVGRRVLRHELRAAVCVGPDRQLVGPDPPGSVDDLALVEGEQWPGQIKTVALEYGLMSSYTAFVAVDSLTRTVGDSGTTVAVPVPVPDGVKYGTSLGTNQPPSPRST